MNLEATADPITIGSAPPYEDPVWYTFYVIGGLIQGAIDVFPSTSLIRSCKNNITETLDNGEIIIDNFALAWDAKTPTFLEPLDTTEAYDYMVEMLTGVIGLLLNAYGIFFNCLYAGIKVFDPQTYEGVFSWGSIYLNILYGVGFFYQDIKYTLTMDTSIGYVYYYKFAYSFADIVMRFFYHSGTELN
eukprot:CAMPEP_0170540368 /NCGR_PEP_ID=MMETSP0211-20121228/372_1 /TAXON_ID=311385 /ORGANISM="Pseudokeronopsis sp., Strain OXSARD2" /LENGTH=187 /DNA_ID=CAMNT_0010842743 /DNA_START=825 /DNA_END=1385 /DNA_ORIENTATION=-